MSCLCSDYTCFDAFVNPCSEGIQLAIRATFTGNLTGRVFFNGVVTTFTVAVEEGEYIVVPSEHFNENSVQQLVTYRSGTIQNCYYVTTHIDFQSPIFTPMPATLREIFVKIFKMGTVSDLNTVFGTPVTIDNGDKITHTDLIDAELISVENVTEELAPITGSGVDDFDDTIGVITLSNEFSDTFFKVTYKKQAS